MKGKKFLKLSTKGIDYIWSRTEHKDSKNAYALLANTSSCISWLEGVTFGVLQKDDLTDDNTNRTFKVIGK